MFPAGPQVCVCAPEFVLRRGIYLFVHRHVGCSISVIYERASFRMWLRMHKRVNWACILLYCGCTQSILCCGV